MAEYESELCQYFISMQNVEDLEWVSGSSSYSSQEENILNYRGQIVRSIITKKGQIMLHLTSLLLTECCVIDTSDDLNFGKYQESIV